MTVEELRANGFEVDGSDEEHDRLMAECFGDDGPAVAAAAWAEWQGAGGPGFFDLVALLWQGEEPGADPRELAGMEFGECSALRAGGY